jgi:hypothetical protein
MSWHIYWEKNPVGKNKFSLFQRLKLLATRDLSKTDGQKNISAKPSSQSGLQLESPLESRRFSIRLGDFFTPGGRIKKLKYIILYKNKLTSGSKMANIQNSAARPTYNTFDRQRAIKLRQRAVDLDENHSDAYYHEQAVELLKQALVLEKYADDADARNFGVTKKNALAVNKTPEPHMSNCYDDIEFENDENQSPEELLRDAMETVL